MQTLAALLKTKPPLIWPQEPSEQATAIETEIRALEAVSLAALRQEWRRRYGEPVPVPRSRDLLLRLLAWRIQAKAFGGLSPETLRILNEPVTTRRKKKAEPDSPSLRKGTVLKRDWRGRQHYVTVIAEGYGHDGKTYKSLTEVARAITGTKWSGPRFFGLEATPKKAKTDQ
jgi:hypothetical protein